MAASLSGDALAGLTVGEGQDIKFLSRVGVNGLGTGSFRMSAIEPQRDGQFGGSMYRTSKLLEFGLQTSSTTALQNLRAAMDTIVDPREAKPLILGEMGFTGSRQLWVRPERCDYVMDAVAALPSGTWAVDAAWIADDPTEYSTTQTTHIFGATGATGGMGTSPAGLFDFTATNGGLRGVVSGRALEVSITAHGAVTNPYIAVMTSGRTDEVVTWHLSMSSGQVLSTDEQLVSRIGSQRVGGRARSGSSAFLRWPRFPAGNTAVRVGCASGTISGTVKVRSTW